MYVLGTNKLKMHTTGVPTFKKKKKKKKKEVFQNVTMLFKLNNKTIIKTLKEGYTTS